MSLGALETLWKATGFRLALLSSAFFVVGTFVLFAFAYFLLSSSLQTRDRDSIEARLRQLAAQYQSTELTGLKKALYLETRLRKTKPYFIRIAAPRNNLVFMEIPDQWADFDLASLERAPLAEPGSFVRLPAKDDASVLEVASLRLPDGSILQVGKSTEERDDILGLFAWILAGVAIPVVAFGVLGGALLALRTLRPIRELIDTVRAIDSGTMAARVPIHQTGDELDELALLFNEMLNRIATLIEGMRGALDNVAHELRTPVTRMRGIAEIALQSDQGPSVAREALSDCIEEADHLLRLLDALMDISEAEAGALSLKLEPINISALLETTVDLYRHVAEEKVIVVSIEMSEQIWLTADRSRLRQVMANLLDNAIKYSPTGGRIELKASRENSEVVIRISDTGIGMTPEELSKIWARLYRGDGGRSERGMGLGLSLVKAIVEAHKGHVEASSTPARGSTFEVILPTKSNADLSRSHTDRSKHAKI
jgi:signal transduction histidine kinase